MHGEGGGRTKEAGSKEETSTMVDAPRGLWMKATDGASSPVWSLCQTKIPVQPTASRPGAAGLSAALSMRGVSPGSLHLPPVRPGKPVLPREL